MNDTEWPYAQSPERMLEERDAEIERLRGIEVARYTKHIGAGGKPMDFRPYPKLARLHRDIIITEKLDGTNACVAIPPDLDNIFAGSRTKWIYPWDDNHGFAAWVFANRDELMKLGPGHHFGEWWGSGINRGYGLTKGDKRFSLFNVSRWENNPDRPACCGVVPVLYSGPFNQFDIDYSLDDLRIHGSYAAPGYMDPEGIVVFHTAGNVAFKQTIKNDDKPKGAK